MPIQKSHDRPLLVEGRIGDWDRTEAIRVQPKEPGLSGSQAFGLSAEYKRHSWQLKYFDQISIKDSTCLFEDGVVRTYEAPNIGDCEQPVCDTHPVHNNLSRLDDLKPDQSFRGN